MENTTLTWQRNDRYFIAVVLGSKVRQAPRKYALEVEEEALICAAEDLGIDGFYRRSDCNPEIVLMMEVAE